jgi:hypothetical protein
VGYFQKTGGRLHGDNFSRCGRWLVPDRKVFQRAKATSLGSANRNFSVGE